MSLRDMVLRHLPSRCIVQKPTTTSDGAGGTTKAFGTRESTVCRIEAIKSSADVPDTLNERIGHRQPYRFGLPYDSGVLPGDRLVVEHIAYEVLTASRQPERVITDGLCVEVG